MAKLSSYQSFLEEGIAHLEDLDLQKFLATVENIAKMQATEKLDGANLWFGLDDEGKLFTSRAGKRKGAENMYSEADYPYFAAYNGFRAAHAALKAEEDKIKNVLRPGDTIEIEVLFGRQPNAVTYGKNYIAFLRGVEGTQDILVDQLANTLNGTSVTVKVQTVDTTDGVKLDLQPADITFQFVGAQKIDTAHLKTADVASQIKGLRHYLSEPAGLEGRQITNFELVTSSLGSFDKEIRPAAKALKTAVLAKIQADFKLPIKKELLDKFVSKVKSPLASDDLAPDEDNGIEGVVLKDPDTGDQVKLVDKDTFTTINQFNHAVRGAISGVIKTLDPNAPIESRGGLLGELKITIADLLGNKELARTQGAKKIFLTFKGKTAEDTVRNAAKQLQGGDDYLGTRRKVLALIDNTKQKLSASLKDFKEHQDDFQLRLKNGKTIGLSAEVIRRTLVAYAETKRDLDELSEKVTKSKSLAQLVAIMYGRIAKAVNAAPEAEEEVTESLNETKIHTAPTEYSGKSAWQLLNIYLATVLTAMIIHKSGDKNGLRILRDKAHSGLTSLNHNMSPLNFWGYPLWRCSTPAVKKLIGTKNASLLHRLLHRVPNSQWKFLHINLSYGSDRKIDYTDIANVVRIIQQFPGLNIDRTNRIVKGVFNYDQADFDEKVKTLGFLYYYVMQFIGTSPLCYTLRKIQDDLLLNANDQNYQMVPEMKLIRDIANLTEDGGAAGAGGGVGGGGAAGSGAVSGGGSGGTTGSPGPIMGNNNAAGSTNASSIASYAQPLFGKGKIITRMKRNPKIVRNKFPAPKELKDKS